MAIAYKQLSPLQFVSRVLCYFCTMWTRLGLIL